MEVFLGAPRLLHVEAREPDHRAGGKEEGEDPVPATSGEDGKVHDHCRRESERYGIDERVELRSETRSRAGRARDPAIERIADTGKHYVKTSGIELAPRGGDDREHPEEQTHQSESVRKDDHTAVARPIGVSPQAFAFRVIGREHHFGRSPRIVTPAVVASPNFVRTVEPTGRKTSTREPNLMIPIRSPCFTFSPSLL